jgi:dihydrofolate reductase
MRELLVTTFLTLDGVMQAPGGPGEDEDASFAYGGWSVSYWDDLLTEVMAEATSKPFAMVLGRKTYDILAAYWPTAPEEAGGKVLNEATKYVASRGRPRLEWSNSVLLEGDAADAVARLKQEEGPELQVHGSANLIQTLLRHGLVDRFRVFINPCVVGTGKRLFGDGTVPAGLKLVDSKVSGTGVIVATYEPAGELPTGTFATE